jgi:hypothetical protein
MGRRTTFYSESPETVAEAENGEIPNFGGGPSVGLDKSVPSLDFFSGGCRTWRGLAYNDCFEMGDFEIRFFSPEAVLDMDSRVSPDALAEAITPDSFAKMLLSDVYPFDPIDRDGYDSARAYVLEYAQVFDEFRRDVIGKGFGLISVTA